MSSRGGAQNLLFVSPTHPDTRGNGLAMRAAMFIAALRSTHRVTLIVLPLFGEATASSQAFANAMCEQSIALPVSESLNKRRRFGLQRLPLLAQAVSANQEAASSALRGQRFESVHVFRLYTAPLALSLSKVLPQGRRLRLQLDLDDIESLTHAELGHLYGLNGRGDEAAFEAREARLYASLERRLLPRFHRLYVCSQKDADWIRPVAQGEIRVVANAVKLPAGPPEPLTTHPFTFLFVGTLDYYPNEDAVVWFCREILPMIRARSRQGFLLRIVGRGLPIGLRTIAATPEVRLMGNVVDLQREYADADAVIVPLRAGGGMRIKVLEAFAYGRPVVSTSIGVDGIGVIPGHDCLIGNTSRAFASQCVRLMEDRELGHDVARNAYSFVARRYTWEAVRSAITEE